MDPIDFENSHIFWRTSNEDSFGWWRPSAVLTVFDSDETTEIALCPPVTAGSMYADKTVIRPRYIYRFLASRNMHRIWRTGLDGNNEPESIGPNAERFREFDFSLKRQQRATVSSNSEMCDAALKGEIYSVRAIIREKTRKTWSIEVPVHHINVNSAGDRFQIESGPVPYFAPDAKLSDTNFVEALSIGDIHTNLMSSATFNRYDLSASGETQDPVSTFLNIEITGFKK